MNLKNINFLLFTCWILFPSLIFSQSLQGKTFDNKNQPLVGVNISWLKANFGSYSNINGEFSISFPKSYPDTLMISYVGFQTQKIIYSEVDSSNLRIELQEGNFLAAFVITTQEKNSERLLYTDINMEVLNAGELRKAACCNLSESFETNASIDASFSDAVSGTRQIKMLGLSGIYSLIQMENIPWIKGIYTSSGLTSIPGTWIESIQISKGVGSVTSGFASNTGLINLEIEKPNKTPKLFLNMYANSSGRAELNIHTKTLDKEKWKSNLLAHVSGTALKNDRNKDGFLDMPIGYNANVFNRWKYEGKNYNQQIGINAYYSDKTGGQTQYLDSPSNDSLYGIQLNAEHVDVFSKSGVFLSKRDNNLGIIAQGVYHNQTSTFEKRTYSGEQKSFYLKTMYNDYISTHNHDIIAGFALSVDDYNESLNDSLFNRTDIIPGAFLEYTFKPDEKFSMIIGNRLDYYTNQNKPLYSPRLHFRVNPIEDFSIKLSGGLAYRIPNSLAENTSLLASSRTWIQNNPSEVEETVNTGITLVKKMTIKEKEVSFSADYFYTYFFNKLIIDLDKNSHEVNIYNLNNSAWSHVLQLETNIYLLENFEVKLAYKFNVTQQNTNNQFQEMLLTPQNRGLISLSYNTLNKQWWFDVTANWVGKQRLADFSENPVEYQLPSYSNDYMLLHLQVTKRFKKWELYLGSENTTNYIQPNAILAANEPQGDFFDATQIWGPINGINIYTGIRLKIK